MLPLLNEFSYSEQVAPRILVLVPTRELVTQVVEKIEAFTAYQSVRVLGVYGGANINTQMQQVQIGCDIVVSTPGRLYDLILTNALKTRLLKKIVIDEVDIMLDLGFRPQLTSIFELLPEKRQHIMFSATMTQEVDELIQNVFVSPEKIEIAVSGTPLENIAQTAYAVPNFYTKVNLLKHFIKQKEEYTKVLIFCCNKRMADRLYENLEEDFGKDSAIIHGNKSQNYRFRSVEQFDSGLKRILIATDVMARGLDIESISHVINFDVPDYPENYMHRIGRTGRAEKQGQTIMFHTENEQFDKDAIEELMDTEIPVGEFPETVEISNELIPEERPLEHGINDPNRNRSAKKGELAAGFHEKKDKNKKENLGGSYKRTIKTKYKKPRTKGDKNANRRKKK
jgi:ATP-dependent RNA helicase RhlE